MARQRSLRNQEGNLRNLPENTLRKSAEKIVARYNYYLGSYEKLGSVSRALRRRTGPSTIES
jgi:hypothetical protein